MVDWIFDDDDSSDEDFDAEQHDESDTEPYPGILHGIDRFEVQALKNDAREPPVRIENPDDVLDMPFDDESSEEEEDKDEMDGSEGAPELSDMEMDEEDLPQEPPLVIDPNNAEVTLNALQLQLVDAFFLLFFFHPFRTSPKQGGWLKNSRTSPTRIRQGTGRQRLATRFSRSSRKGLV